MPDLPIYDNTHLLRDAAACLVAVGLITRVYLARAESRLPLPPSPPTWRLQGHFYPIHNSFLTVAKWIDEYGPVITIRSGTQKMVVIGRHKAAMDIMETQGAALADRPRTIAIGEMLAGGMGVVSTPAGERLRRMRRVLHAHLQPKAAEAYEPLQTSFAKHMVLNVLNDPYNFHDHSITYAVTTIRKIAYGRNAPTPATDPVVKQVLQASNVLRGAIVRPGAYMVDSIPWLKYLPWYGRELKNEFQNLKRLHLNQLNSVKQQMQSNMNVGPSFAKHMLEDGISYGLSENEMAFLAGALFGAGSNTTSVAISTVLMAAACFPKEQARVQAELDAIIGKHRAPTFADRQSLPCLQAFICEALRWRPSAANGLAHRTIKDVIWGGYCIPAGTTVYGNHWAISRDPEVFPEPHAFKPQRWINDQGLLRDDLHFFFYGFGRRVCPGQHVANRSIFINLVLILWAFQLTLDPTAPLDDMGFMNGDVQRPCTIKFKTRMPETELRHMMREHPVENHEGKGL